jgi:preprotein translocase subunit SecB
VLGFAIANFSAYYESHKTEDDEFEVNLPAKVPANLEEEMDFDAEAIRSGVRIAEFY